MVCDFCSAPDPHWICPCATYLIPDLNVESTGDWAACDACVELVCHRDWEGLVRRGLLTNTAQILKEFCGEDHAISEIKMMHRGYREHALGEPRRREITTS